MTGASLSLSRPVRKNWAAANIWNAHTMSVTASSLTATGFSRRRRLARHAFRRLARYLRAAVGEGALRDGDDSLDERPQFLRLRHGCRYVLVAQERRGLIPKHRDTMLRHTAELSVRNSMSHGGSQ